MNGYALDVGAALAGALRSQLTGAYLHGSAVLGGFDARRSDVDVIAVCAGPLTASQQAGVASAVTRVPCPARGLELSVVILEAALCPTASPAFELHLTTGDANAKVVDGVVADSLVAGQLAEELRWGAEHAPGEYAVLNACRAWRFAVDGALVSKVSGGEWALTA